MTAEQPQDWLSDVIDSVYAAGVRVTELHMDGKSSGTITSDTLHEARATILAHMNEVIGEDLPTFGPQNEAGDIDLDDYISAGINQRLAEQRQRLNSKG